MWLCDRQEHSLVKLRLKLFFVYSMCFWLWMFLLALGMHLYVQSLSLFRECYTLDASSRNASHSAILVQIAEGMSRYVEQCIALDRDAFSVYALYDRNDTQCATPWLEIEFLRQHCSDCCNVFCDLISTS